MQHIVPQGWPWDRTVRSTCPTMCADGSTELSIVAAPMAVQRALRHVRAPQLRPAIPLKRPRDRRRARIQTLARLQRAIFPFPKARRKKWLRSVNASTAAKWLARPAQAAMVRAVRARLEGLT